MNLLIPEGKNLVVYYVLPFARVNSTTFGRKFRTAYINDKATKVHVELSSPLETPNYEISPYYESTVDMLGVCIVTFSIPEEFLPDTKLFKEGLYSKMSKEAKKLIYKTSGLAYNHTMEDFTVTHPVLHALASTAKLRSFLINHLQVNVMADSGELIDKPDESWFIEHRIAEVQATVLPKKI